METIEKIDVKQMKADIKKMVEEQRFYKLQRKTNIPNSDRNIPAREAQWKHTANRQKLRLMYAAYGIARGKSLQQIENNHKEEVHPLEQYMDIINDRIDKYRIQVPVEAIEQ
jgi:hypothetical protein